MNLRSWIKLMAIIVLAWPTQAHAQPSVGTRHIGVLTYLEENDPSRKFISMHLFKRCRSSVGPAGATSGSITVGPAAIPSARASMRLNSLHSHLTSYWPPAVACWARSRGDHHPHCIR